MYPEIPVTKTANPKAKPVSENSLGFGQLFTDHMFIMDYIEGQGWIEPRIVPYGPIEMELQQWFFIMARQFRRTQGLQRSGWRHHALPSAFEFRTVNKSNERMVIPQVDLIFVCTPSRSCCSWKKTGYLQHLTFIVRRPFILPWILFLV
jgi:branched-chain amino acid aminotransferase